MHFVLYGESGAACWLSTDLAHAKPCEDSSAVLSDDRPGNASCAYLLERFPALSRPVHCLSSQKTRGGGALWKAHQTTYPYPPDSFRHIGNGLYAPCPELCFIQACTTTTDYRALKIGAALCGTFLVQPQTSSGLTSRQPITTPDRIRHYLKHVPHLDGAKKAARLLPHIPRNAASPPEAFLFFALALPGCWGGCHLPPPLLNRRIKPGRKARAIARRESLVPDLYWPHAKVALEFDSDAMHLNSAQATRDSTKRLALESSGHRTFTVTTNQLASSDHINQVALQLARSLGCSTRSRSQSFPRKQAELFAEGWSLNWLFDPSWLAPQVPKEDTDAEESRTKLRLHRTASPQPSVAASSLSAYQLMSPPENRAACSNPRA